MKDFWKLPTGWNYMILGIVTPKAIIFLIVLTDQSTYCGLFSVYQEVGNKFSNASHLKDGINTNLSDAFPIKLI